MEVPVIPEPIIKIGVCVGRMDCLKAMMESGDCHCEDVGSGGGRAGRMDERFSIVGGVI